MTWLKTHERKLWWAFLGVCLPIGFLRDPQCAGDVPWWAIVVPLATMAAIFGLQLWHLRRLRERPRATYVIPPDQPEGEDTLPDGTSIRWKVTR